MEEIIKLTELDFSSLFVSVFIILIGLRAVVSAFEWIIEKLGIESKSSRSKKEDHNLLIRTSQNLATLQEEHVRDVEKSDARDDKISSDIEKLTQMFIDKEIDDMRWEINNFATKVSEGRPCNKDSFQHCIHVYEKYEKILEENGLENGEVEISMDIINDVYKQKLKDGFANI